jgi:ubiquitin-conjugating enzyme E2 Z
MSKFKRWNNDLKELVKNPIDNVLIHYDEEDSSKFFVVVIGLDDTPYQGGFYPFVFECSDSYPFSPPKVTFIGQSIYKIHPNLHPNGYVCLSLLNLDDSCGWRASMTLSSLIMSIMSLFTNNPLKNEPLYEKNNESDTNNANYQKIAEFYNYKHYVDEFIKNPVPLMLKDLVEKFFMKNYDKYQNRLVELISQNLDPYIIYSVFDGDLVIDYSSVDLSI